MDPSVGITDMIRHRSDDNRMTNAVAYLPGCGVVRERDTD